MGQDSSELSALPDIELIASSLAEAGHEVLPFAATDAASLCDFLHREAPQLVFNLCDSFADRSDLELNVAALFELFRIPVTGSPAFTLGLAQNKAHTKAVFEAKGIPSAAYCVIAPGGSAAEAHRLRFPLIVKPVAEDASVGIDDGAVVATEAALAERVKFVWREFRQAALVEEFIDGREFHVSIIATGPGEFSALPISEIAFDGLAEGRPRILSYDAKWDNAATFRQNTALRCPVELDPKVAETLCKTAVSAARAVGLRDYGRIDFRVRDGDQAVFVLEVNPNPDLNPECKFMRAALMSGRSYGDTIREIAERAIERSDGRTPSRRGRGRTTAIKTKPSERVEAVVPARRKPTRTPAVKRASKRTAPRLISKVR
jgi:D-alanine-D-alanine ligase